MDHGGAIFDARISPPISSTLPPAEASVQYIGDGTYRIDARLAVPGPHSIHVAMQLESHLGPASLLQWMQATAVCPPTFALAGEDSGVCRCDVGMMPDLESSPLVCVPCRVGFWKATVASTPCTSCPAHATTERAGATAANECICNVGFFNTQLSSEPVICKRCMIPGTRCNQRGVELQTLPLLSGYYRASVRSAEVLRCSDAAVNCSDYACEYSTSGCRGGSNASEPCMQGLEGHFCELCTESHSYYVAASPSAVAQCAPCGATSALTIAILAAVATCAMAVAKCIQIRQMVHGRSAAARAAHRGSSTTAPRDGVGTRNDHPVADRHAFCNDARSMQRYRLGAGSLSGRSEVTTVQNAYHWVRILWARYSLGSKIKILLSFYQIAVKIPSVYRMHTDLPSSTVNALSFIEVGVSLGLESGWDGLRAPLIALGCTASRLSCSFGPVHHSWASASLSDGRCGAPRVPMLGGMAGRTHGLARLIGWERSLCALLQPSFSSSSFASRSLQKWHLMPSSATISGRKASGSRLMWACAAGRASTAP